MGLWNLLFKTDEKQAELTDANPLREGKEELGCYGAFFIHPSPARTLSMLDKVDALVKYELKPAWGITDSTTAKTQLDALAALNATAGINLNADFTPDMIQAYKDHEATGKKFGGSPEVMKASEKLVAIYHKYGMGFQTGFNELLKKAVGMKVSEVLCVTNVSAWDIERLAGLARKCHHAGFITEDECYSYMEKARELAKGIYTDWRQYVAGFFMGRGICYGEENFGQWTATAASMLHDANCIWQEYPLA